MLYCFCALLFIWIVAVQAGCLSMRTSDKKWKEQLQQKGQVLEPHFYNIPSEKGRRIHAIAISRQDSLPLIVLLHGSPGSADAFMSYLADSALSEKARLVAIDRPGFGYSSGFGKPEPSQSVQAAAVKSVIDSLAPGKPVLLVGHSLGCSVIARFAMDYPKLAAGLILVAGSVDPAQEKHPWWQSLFDKKPFRWLIPKSMWTSNAEIIPLENELTEMLPMWEKVTCPVTLVHAKNDALVPVANIDFAQKMLVNSSHVQVELLQKGNHFILWTRVDLIRKIILQHL
ncbi:MAG: alpha/beta hydrolase [Saprospiraceae bacterium]|nr:alpha/beta hydrolase [Lewinellaceae bacterium]